LDCSYAACAKNTIIRHKSGTIQCTSTVKQGQRLRIYPPNIVALGSFSVIIFSRKTSILALFGAHVLYHAALYMKQFWHHFSVFHYVSVRAICSLIGTLLFSFAFGDRFVSVSRTLFRTKTRPLVPKNHLLKGDMPTMGGIFIIAAVFVNALLWTDLTKPLPWLFLLCLASFGVIGGWDDWCKIHRTRGLHARDKFLLQLAAALVVIVCWLWATDAPTSITMPFFKHYELNLGILFIPWAVLVLLSACNAVNLTDGLDGLAIGSLIPNFATFSLIAYAAGHQGISSYLHIPFAGTAEVAIIGTTLVGASLGFFWYNAHPAQIFMGDIGSLALGATLALMALAAKQELLLIVAGGLFVFETATVILQVLSFKLTGKRLFKMAPIHHHFELLGWPESKITARFGIITIILCLLALVSLKFR